MADIRKIGIDEVVEAAAAGVLRALDARGSASEARHSNIQDLVKSGFTVDFIIRAGGWLGGHPISLPGLQQGGQLEK
jgi:hypothetical protein